MHKMGQALVRPLHFAIPSCPVIAPPAPLALLLAAHGERRGGAGNEGVARLAGDLAARNLVAEVGVGFIKGVPGIAEALWAFSSRDVLVYPLFLADGYFNRDRLPQLIAAAQAPPATARRIRVLPPLGLDPGLVEVVAGRAQAAAGIAGFAPGSATLVVLAHGTPRDPASRQAAESVSNRLAATGRFAAVRPAFLEEPPSLAGVLADVAGAAVVIGLFAGEGLHGGVDVPQLIGEIARADIAFAGNVGTFTEITDLVAAAVRDASTRGGE
jgi:sirohydrochlorin cobaltochelatase